MAKKTIVIAGVRLQFTRAGVFVYSALRAAAQHFSAFFAPLKGKYTPHITTATGHHDFLAAFRPEAVERVLKTFEREVLSLWLRASFPVELEALERDGYQAYVPPPKMKEWVEREMLRPRTSFDRNLLERFCREALGRELPAGPLEGEVVEAFAVALFRDHAVPPTALARRHDAREQQFAVFHDGNSYREGFWLRAFPKGDELAWVCTPISLQSSEEFRLAMLRSLGPGVLKVLLTVNDRLALDLDRAVLEDQIRLAEALQATASSTDLGTAPR